MIFAVVIIDGEVKSEYVILWTESSIPTATTNSSLPSVTQWLALACLAEGVDAPKKPVCMRRKATVTLSRESEPGNRRGGRGNSRNHWHPQQRTVSERIQEPDAS